jgi:hypothetical protein
VIYPRSRKPVETPAGRGVPGIFGFGSVFEDEQELIRRRQREQREHVKAQRWTERQKRRLEARRGR